MIINQNNTGKQVLIEGNVQVEKIIVNGVIIVNGKSDQDESGSEEQENTDKTHVLAVKMNKEDVQKVLTAKNSEKMQIVDILQEVVKKIVVKSGKKKIESIRLKSAYVKLANEYGEKGAIGVSHVNRLLGKAERVEQCGNYLKFEGFKDSVSQKLAHVDFCHDRLCMICAWHRSQIAYAENRQCFDKLMEKGRFIFLTLTAKNVESSKLGKEIDRYFNAFRDMIKDKLVKKSILGWMRSLEVTYNQDMDTYHPHIHAILHVPDDYFKGGKYLNQKKWRKLWEQYAELDYDSQVYVKAIKDRNGDGMWKAIAEVSKYCVKFSNLSKLPKNKYTEVIGVLDWALLGRRLTTYGGTWRLERKKVKEQYSSLKNEDLSEEEREFWYEMLYEWMIGERKYYLISVKKGGEKIGGMDNG